MSKDMLGSVVRAAVGVPQDRLDLLAKMASDMAGYNPLGEIWHRHYQEARTQSPPNYGFKRNRYGHIIVTIVGLSLTGSEELDRLSKLGFVCNRFAESCFLGAGPDSYDQRHRLENGQKVSLALIPGNEIKDDRDRTIGNVLALGTEKYGYDIPFAGQVPRIRESVSPQRLRVMGYGGIQSLHRPIYDAEGTGFILATNDYGNQSCVAGSQGLPHFLADQFFAFPTSED